MIAAAPPFYALQGKGGNGRAMQICTTALWCNCHCPRCRPDIHLPPASGAIGPAPEAAAVRVIPPAADGGTYPTTPGVAGARAPDPAADRNPSLSVAPIGGLCPDGRA